MPTVPGLSSPLSFRRLWTRVSDEVSKVINAEIKQLPADTFLQDPATADKAFGLLSKVGILPQGITSSSQIPVTSVKSSFEEAVKKFSKSEALEDAPGTIQDLILKGIKQVLGKGNAADVRVLRYANPEDRVKDLASFKQTAEKIDAAGVEGFSESKPILKNLANLEVKLLPMADNATDMLMVSQFKFNAGFSNIKSKVVEIGEKITTYIKSLTPHLKQIVDDLSGLATKTNPSGETSAVVSSAHKSS